MKYFLNWEGKSELLNTSMAQYFFIQAPIVPLPKVHASYGEEIQQLQEVSNNIFNLLPDMLHKQQCVSLDKHRLFWLHMPKETGKGWKGCN